VNLVVLSLVVSDLIAKQDKAEDCLEHFYLYFDVLLFIATNHVNEI